MTTRSNANLTIFFGWSSFSGTDTSKIRVVRAGKVRERPESVKFVLPVRGKVDRPTNEQASGYESNHVQRARALLVLLQCKFPLLTENCGFFAMPV